MNDKIYKNYKIKVNVATIITICIFAYLIIKSDYWEIGMLLVAVLAIMSAVSLHFLMTMESYDAYREIVYDEEILNKLNLSEQEFIKYIVSELTVKKSFVYILMELLAEPVYALIHKSSVIGTNLYSTTYLSMYYIDEHFLIKSLKRIIPIAEKVYSCTYDDYMLVKTIKNNVDVVMLDSVKWNKIFNKYKLDIHINDEVILDVEN